MEMPWLPEKMGIMGIIFPDQDHAILQSDGGAWLNDRMVVYAIVNAPLEVITFNAE